MRTYHNRYVMPSEGKILFHRIDTLVLSAQDLRKPVKIRVPFLSQLSRKSLLRIINELEKCVRA